VSEINPDIILILISCIYFKGLWKRPFKVENTLNDSIWTNSDGKQEKCQLMVHRKKKISYMEDNDAQICFLDYGKEFSTFSMAVILPKDRSKSLKDFVNDNFSKKINSWIGSSECPRSIGTLFLPKLDINPFVDVIPKLKEMGLEKIFNHSHDALNKISDLAKVNNAVHMAVLKMDEKGAEAAAVTVILCSMCCPPVTPVPHWEMNCDRPFLISIFDKQSRTICFLGAIENI
jgi:serine protease inhibitor